MNGALSPHHVSPCGKRLGWEPGRVPTDTELRDHRPRSGRGRRWLLCPSLPFPLAAPRLLLRACGGRSNFGSLGGSG